MTQRDASHHVARASLAPGQNAIGAMRGRLLSIRGVHLVSLGAAVYAILFSAASILAHASFRTRRFDLGNMTQAVWSTAHGRFLDTTAAAGDQFVRLGAHVDPILAVFALPWLIWPSPYMLLVAQAIILSLGAVPVYWLALKHLDSQRLATCFAFVYLLYPPTQWNILPSSNFHPISLGIPLLLFAIWYLDEAKYLPFVAFAVLAAATSEQIPLLVATLGVWYAIRRRRLIAGAAIAAGGLTWFLSALLIVMPHFAPPSVDLFAEGYGSLGGSPGGVLKTLFTDPGHAFEKIATLQGFAYVLLLLLPIAGLALFEPVLLACAFPTLLANLLSDQEIQRSIFEHYTAGIVPFAIAAAVLGTSRLGVDRVPRWWRLLLVSAVVFGTLLSPMWRVPGFIEALVSPAHEARKAAIALIPPNVAVSSTDKLGAHLSERHRVFTFPTIGEAQWVALDLSDPWLAVDPGDPNVRYEENSGRFRHFLKSLESDARWRRVFARHGVLVFHARTPTDGRSP